MRPRWIRRVLPLPGEAGRPLPGLGAGSLVLSLLVFNAVFALTRLRIVALLWMALVGIGLLLICWRLLAGRGADWLINANVATTLAVLSVVSVVDLGALAANWNVRHAREVGGAGANLDFCYLDSLGAPALVALARLETTTDDPDLRERAMVVRRRIAGRVGGAQYGLRGWIWRDARRLNRVAEITPPRWIGHERPGRRGCDGRLLQPRSVPSSALTPPAGV
jgi:hypothetical protein